MHLQFDLIALSLTYLLTSYYHDYIFIFKMLDKRQLNDRFKCECKWISEYEKTVRVSETIVMMVNMYVIISAITITIKDTTTTYTEVTQTNTN